MNFEPAAAEHLSPHGSGAQPAKGGRTLLAALTLACRGHIFAALPQS